jgi:hypothetical protein
MQKSLLLHWQLSASALDLVSFFFQRTHAGRQETPQGHQIAVNAVLGLHNGDIASASGDGTVKIWSGSSGQ